jgi:restriction endonuclease S subunit
MPADWQESSIGEHVDLVTGEAFQSARFGTTADSGTLLARGDNIKEGRFEWGDKARYWPELTPQLDKYLLREGDVLVGMDGSKVGKNWVQVRKKDLPCLLVQRVARLRAKGSMDQGFLRYLIGNPKFSSFVDRIKTGTSIPHVSGGQIKSYEILLPPIAEQKAIAAVLGALDDKIELNLRMNATLEAMGRALFQSWFVDFDPVRARLDGLQPIGLDPPTAAIFPNEFENSELGPIPKGWHLTNLGEVVEVFDSKRVPLSGREREQRRGPYPYYGAASVMDHVDDYLFDGVYMLMGEDGSVINEDGTPVTQYVWGKFWVNNHAHVLRGKNGISTEHLLLHLSKTNISAFVTGAVQPKLNQANMNRIEFILPSSEVANAFRNTVEPFFAQIRANTDQARTLAIIRDTLLPKLLSRQLKIPI